MLTLPPPKPITDNIGFNELVFNTLSKDSQTKVEYIYMIASYMQDLGEKPMTPKAFDKLYDNSIADIMDQVIGLQDALLYLLRQETL